MKTFEILSIKLENIKSYKFQDIMFIQGNNVFIGENGAGKSTILESIYLSLFGETVVGRNLVDMVRYGEKQGKISIRFSVDGIEYRVEDEIIIRDINRATQAQVLINETLEETIAEGKNAVKAKIEEILDVDAITFISAVYASQGEISKIITAKDMERKKLFDRLFQIERFEKTWSNLAKVEKIINSENEKIHSEIKLLNNELAEQPEILKLLKERIKQLEEDKIVLSLHKKEFLKIDSLHSLLEKYNEKYNQLIGEKNTLETNIQQLEVEINKKVDLIRTLSKNDVEYSYHFIKNLETLYKNKAEKLNVTIQKKHEEESKLKLILEKIRQLNGMHDNIFTTITNDKNELENEIKVFRVKVIELQPTIDSWNEQIPILLEKKQIELNNKNKIYCAKEQTINEITKLGIQLKALNDSKEKYDSLIFKKRFILSKEVGENWNELIDEYSKINFEKELFNLKTMIISNEKINSELMNKQSVIDVALKRIQEDLKHLGDLHGNETCPTCKQILSKDTLTQLRKTLTLEKSNLSDEKKVVYQKGTELIKVIDNQKIQEKELVTKQSTFNKIESTFNDLNDLEDEKKSVEEEYKKVELHFNKLAKTSSAKELTEIENEIKECAFLIQTLKDANETLPKLNKKQERINENTMKAKEMEEEINNLKSITKEEYFVQLCEELAKLDEELLSINTLQDSIKALGNDLLNLEREKQKLQVTVTSLLEIEKQDGFCERNKIREQRENLNKEISSLESSIYSLNENIIPPLIRRKDALALKGKALKKQKENYTLENKKKEILVMLRGLMRELPNRLLPNFIERINATATEILQALIPGSDIQNIILNNDYSLNIIRLGNQESISILSGGETIIIALALRLAFAKEFSTLDFLMLDEPTVFLDERRRGELVSVLERNRLVRQMFVVTHDHDFERISDKTYYITKEYGQTTVKTLETEEDNASDIAEFDLL